MISKSFVLTKNEREIMELLWREKRPLSRSEIIALSVNRSWKANSIHILLNQLLDKGAIEVNGFVKTGKNYGRTFTAALTEQQYQVMQFRTSSGYARSKASALVNLVSTLVDGEELNEQTLDRLKELLDKKKADMK